MLRCYCSENKRDWDDGLPLLEFHYNNSCNASTRQSPFYVNYGYHPKFGIAAEVPEVEAVRVTVEELKAIWDSTKRNLE